MSQQIPPIQIKPLLTKRFEIIVDPNDGTYQIHDRITGCIGLAYHSLAFYEDLSIARQESAERFDSLCEAELEIQRQISHDGYGRGPSDSPKKK